MFYLRVYIWMTQNTEREAGGGRGDEYRWFLCMPSSGKRWGGAERCLPFRCPSSVKPVREERQCWWQLVTETAGCPTIAPACDPLWGDNSPKKRKEKWRKKTSFTNQNSRPDANRRPMPRGRPAGMSDNTNPVTERHISFFLLPSALRRVFTHQRRGTGGCQLNQVTFPRFHFFHPKFEYEKGLSFT